MKESIFSKEAAKKDPSQVSPNNVNSYSEQRNYRVTVFKYIFAGIPLLYRQIKVLDLATNLCS